MSRCVIIGNAGISDYDRLRRELRPDDFLVVCDGGQRHLAGLRAVPDLIVGDFDSGTRPETETETLVLPREKDDTDTVFAAREAFRRGFRDFLLLGVAGGRLDHTLGNVYLLLWLDGHGCSARLLDDYSEMCIVSREAVEVEDSCAFFSLLNIAGTARGIEITGAKYPLAGGEICSDYQYGISNEVLPGGKARISLREGSLLLICVFRDAYPPAKSGS